MTSGDGSVMADERLDLLDGLQRFRGDHLAAGARDQHVVLDAHADALECFRRVRAGGDVEAGLDREHHAGAERRGLTVLAVGADVVDVVVMEKIPKLKRAIRRIPKIVKIPLRNLAKMETHIVVDVVVVLEVEPMWSKEKSWMKMALRQL